MADLSKITCIEDLRKVAKRKVPKMFYDYVDCGSYTQSTYYANTTDFERLKFRQRVAVNISNRSTATTMLGEKVSMPLAISPTGITGMQRADGEILAAKAAEAFGIPFTLSTMSCCSIEDVAANTTRPFWFQLYMMKDRDFMARLIQRAKKAGCSALVVTLDLQVPGQRHLDIKNGLSTPPKPTLRNLLNLATKPEWCWHMLHTNRRSFGNIVGHIPQADNLKVLSKWTVEQFDTTLNWNDLEWIKEQWGGKIILKGILDPRDAEMAVQHGADAIVVSNHGGRQLDGAPSTIQALPAIVERVKQLGSSMEIYIDGGIRTGQDILRAYALGADAVMVGRAFLYGLGAYGQAGVYKALELLQKELDISMAFCGHTDINKVNKDILIIPNDFAQNH
ncbi:alpha-hydroxy acid oxidase [Pelistega europaea]|uniref:Alpha-hydroxy-acid oxidizing protein n=1 Tax=Pelistega europaea TaxID=106147 RepID=A0A7Y4LBF3_9BURK|nr:alpha-hydroxy acid oxidase [Pelistega europaea]NOL49372.1 alpha-hydroxy-acid oxidizing protein [Pelistega europaea]